MYNFKTKTKLRINDVKSISKDHMRKRTLYIKHDNNFVGAKRCVKFL